MRILLLSHGYPPTISGVTVVVQKLARALVSHGHQVAVLTASESNRPYRSEDQGVQLIRTPSFHNPIWSEGPIPALTNRSFNRLVTDFRPDVIHTHENFILALQLARVRGRLKVPTVVSCHAVPDFVAQFLPRIPWLDQAVVRLVWFYMVRVLNSFDVAVFPTQTHRDLFLDQGLAIRPVVISNGVDTNRFHPPNGQFEDVDRRYQLPAGQRILFVGRLCQDKNLETLIRAMPEISARKRAHLLLVGRGDHRPGLEELVQERRLQDNVHFLGYVPEADLPAIYRASNLFAITSKVEVQSIPTLQALVSGLPVVAADSGALPELVRHGVNGYLAPADDPRAVGQAALQILKNPSRIKQFGQASIAIGRQHAEAYTFKAFMDLYQQLVVSRWNKEYEFIHAARPGSSRARRRRLLR
jgi:1,2-diacylglycerol 3-alpha-glucosyltransferase